MNRVSLFIRLGDLDLGSAWDETIQGLGSDAHKIDLSDDILELENFLAESDINVAIVATSSNKLSLLNRTLKVLFPVVGCHPMAYLILCDEFNPRLMTQVFEFGIENIFGLDDLQNQCKDHIARNLKMWDLNEQRELALRKVWKAIHKFDQRLTLSADEHIGYYLAEDYLSNYVFAHALRARGMMSQSIGYLKRCVELNQYFRPGWQDLAQTFLIVGKAAEAIRILELLDKQWGNSIDRKLCLATAWAKCKDFEKAEYYRAEAEAIESDHPGLKELAAHILLIKGQIGEAFKMMGDLINVGPVFAAKLNEIGIRLSAKGKVEQALALYQKAHRIVRPELRFKLSLNSAVACYRLKKLGAAVKFLDQCEAEFGQEYEKAQEIRLRIQNVANRRSQDLNQAG